MGLLADLPLDDLSPSGLWSRLDPDVRRLAARSVYTHAWEQASDARDEANEAIAEAIRFRPVMVRKLPFDKRADYLAQRVRPDDSLATSLLIALHLGNRGPMLSAFLDHLQIPHRDGLIDEAHELRPVEPDALAGAVSHLLERFPRDEVEVYLASLLAIDDDTWGGLKSVLQSSSITTALP